MSDVGAEEMPANPKVKDVWVSKDREIWICRVAGQWQRYLSPTATGPGKDFQPGFLDDEEGPDDSDEPGQDGEK